MAEQTSAPWKESETKGGQKYQVSASHYDITDQSAPAANSPFQCLEIRNKTGITYYKLEEVPWYSIKK
ncbi:hypothetical protein CSIM01_11458 [Colletotrichum simmondsii]|uniref:Uncharacterized protein n=1 Tax=Colletotrichum simmondsii TaxID=703756 RepID=A0A135RRR3_9PEZI|nr:hypothetical protein CSIM01_11458 [Colletotrichum simmondsii]